LNRCDRCGCYLLSRDIENHPNDCKMDDNTAHIHPDVCFAGTSCAIEKRETYLPSDSFGWRKTNTVLLNPDTIEMLGILPRSPCLLTGQSTSSRIVVVWPCAEVSPLRISVHNLPPERMVKLQVLKQITELKLLQLYPNDDVDYRLLSAEHFLHYVKVYMMSSFVSPDYPVTISYLAKNISFGVHEDDVDRLNRLAINKASPVVYSLAHDFDVSFVETYR